ncbi:MAG: AmmeMemoRadiSam system radical SAM enzyme [Cyanobacteriota bacterium]
MVQIFKGEEELKKAGYFEQLNDNKVLCKICGNECILIDGQPGRCRSRENIKGEMFLSTYSVASSVAVDPIEKKPLYHFYPGTSVFSIGGWGCNFNCIHCQNWQISQPAKTMTRGSYHLTPQESIKLTLSHKSQGICWTYNEPAIWFEYTLDSAKLAKENNLYTAYVTNGFLNKEPLKELSKFLDAYRVDFKCFDDKNYQELCGIKNWKNIYNNTVYAKELGIHIEIVTNIVPGFNDSDETLKNIAEFICNNLGPDTPWHVTRFFPNNKLNNIDPTPISTIEKAVEIGKAYGLYYIYKGNCPGKSETVCPKCGTVAVERDFNFKIHYLPGGKCCKCNHDLNIRC